MDRLKILPPKEQPIQKPLGLHCYEITSRTVHSSQLFTLLTSSCEGEYNHPAGYFLPALLFSLRKRIILSTNNAVLFNAIDLILYTP